MGPLRPVGRLLEVLRLWRAVEVPVHPSPGHPGRAQVPRVEGGVAALQHGALQRQQLEEDDHEKTQDDDATAVTTGAVAKYDERLCQVTSDTFRNGYALLIHLQLNMQK